MLDLKAQYAALRGEIQAAIERVLEASSSSWGRKWKPSSAKSPPIPAASL